jgi:protein phosphatase
VLAADLRSQEGRRSSSQNAAYLQCGSLGPVDLWRIALDDQQPGRRMAPCEFVAESERSARFSREVCALMETMYYLVTNRRTYDDTLVLSPPGVGMLFDRVLCGLEAPTAAQLAKDLQKGVVEVRRPSSVDVRVGRLSDVGQTRQLNEDSLLSIEIGRVRRSISEPLGLYIVCDGMGGHAAGDVASGLVVQTLARKALAEVLGDGVAERTPPDWEVWLKNALQEANQAVRPSFRAPTWAQRSRALHGDTVTVGHAGDSRCYVISQDIRQLTADHSLVQRSSKFKRHRRKHSSPAQRDLQEPGR